MNTSTKKYAKKNINKLRIPLPDELTYCPTCGNLKIKGEKCPECKKYENLEITKIQRHKKDKKKYRIVEINNTLL
jgi:ribosomal protein L32